MNIRKLPSGSYQIRQTLNGKNYTVTVPYKPKKYEAEELIQEKIYGAEIPFKGTVLQKSLEYINKCRGNKSPSTIINYESMTRNTPTWFKDYLVSKLTVVVVEKCIKEYASNHSPKSTNNFIGFYKCLFADLSHLDLKSIKLLDKTKKYEYEPTTRDIQAILGYVKGTRYECVLNLACIGLRRGEAISITANDLDENNVLTINKDIIWDGKEYIVKNHPKTEVSNRRILIPSYLAELIRKQGNAFEGNPHTINEYLHKVQDKLGIPRFRLHILRHFASATLHKNGFTDKQIMAYMGWSCISTLHQTYNYNLDPEESQKDIAEIFSVTFS